MYATRSNNPPTLPPCNPGSLVAQAAPKSGRQVVPRPSQVLLIDSCHLLAAGFFICNTRTHTHTHTNKYIKIHGHTLLYIWREKRFNPLMPLTRGTILRFDKWRIYIKRALVANSPEKISSQSHWGISLWHIYIL